MRRAKLSMASCCVYYSFFSSVTDIRRVCPLQDLAKTAAKSFTGSRVYSYVANQPREKLHGITDSTSDVEAILGTYATSDVQASEAKYVKNVQEMFYTFVATGELPQNKDALEGVYTVGSEVATHAHYPNCDFWKSAQNIVPDYADFN